MCEPGAKKQKRSRQAGRQALARHPPADLKFRRVAAQAATAATAYHTRYTAATHKSTAKDTHTHTLIPTPSPTPTAPCMHRHAVRIAAQGARVDESKPRLTKANQGKPRLTKANRGIPKMRGHSGRRGKAHRTWRAGTLFADPLGRVLPAGECSVRVIGHTYTRLFRDLSIFLTVL